MPLTSTPTLVQQVRDAVSEQIPAGGTEANTLFTDAELATIIGQVDYIDLAIAEAWARKGGRLVSKRGGITEIAAGTERIKYEDPLKLAEHAFKMADQYRAQAPQGGSHWVAVEQPDVLGALPAELRYDVSRLLVEPVP